MKKTNTIYWIFTGLFGALMLFSAIPNIMQSSDSITFMNQHLGYPIYLISFIGWAKALGVLAILIPGYPRIKEWAYAGLAFDLVGALYSMLALDGLSLGLSFMLLPFGLGAISYIYFQKKYAA